jgi:hypothetical protein
MPTLLKTFALPLLLVSACLGLGTAAQAEERPMSGTEIRAALTDKWMRSTDPERPSMQLFLVNGSTHYAQGTATSVGRWEVRGDQYCSVWPPSTAWECYDMTQNGQEFVFISKSGVRYGVTLDK